MVSGGLMEVRRDLRGKFGAMLFLIVCLGAVTGLGQEQVIQRGALGRPDKVMDDTLQWTTPLMVVTDKDYEIYIPDITAPEWLARNYQPFIDKGHYVISIFTFYKNMKACEANQIAWGYGDAAHLDACNDIGYRVRQVTVETTTKTVSLMMAAMIDQNGNIMPDTVNNIPRVKLWKDLDTDSQKMLEKTSEIVTKAMTAYDIKMQNRR
jgi:hypothetical protein